MNMNIELCLSFLVSNTERKMFSLHVSLRRFGLTYLKANRGTKALNTLLGKVDYVKRVQ